MLQEGQALYDIVNKEKIPVTKDSINLPDNWAWVSNWQLDTARACDDDGQCILQSKPSLCLSSFLQGLSIALN